jgi:glycosyltransferase involved in cell wall biosynthesis
MFEAMERRSLHCLTHVFTFGDYVRRHMIDHYGLDPAKVTAVGCGMGKIEAYYGPKDYGSSRLLFVAKHLFAAKGGLLLDQAFRIAHRQRPDLRLTIVGDSRTRDLVTPHPAIELRDHLSWDELQRLFRQSTLLVQPMLNDPWGQVYTEALISRTPVIGLNRNGLPEIIEHGRHGFLVDQATPEALAATIIAAVSDPVRLERMGVSGQARVMQSYSWEQVARRIAYLPDVPAAA